MDKNNILVFYNNRDIWELFLKIFVIFMFLSLSIYTDVIILFERNEDFWGLEK